MEWNLETIFSLVTAVVTLAVAITALTPTPKDDGIVKIIRKVLDAIAGNFLNAKNSD